jgi:DNA-directed RNA polymerase subunit L
MKNLQSQIESFLPDQEEISFSDSILFEVNNYKNTLQKYIVADLLKQHPEIYVGYFNCHPLLNQLTMRCSDPIMNMYSDLTKNDDIRKIFSARLNLLRALANYQKMYNAYNILNFSTHNIAIAPDLATTAGRIRALFQRYPDFQKHLKTVGNLYVDKSTNKIKNFFKTLWSNIVWCFSEPHRQEKVFTHQIRYLCRQYNFFKTHKTNTTASLPSLQIRPSLH